MDSIITFEESLELSQQMKLVKRLKKYMLGLPKTPPNHQERIANNIENLKKRLKIDDIETLTKLEMELEKKIESAARKTQARTYIEQLQGWYIRPLINHFDNVNKIQTFTSSKEGTKALKHKLQLSIPSSYYADDREIIIENLHQLFKFKAGGKGTPKSQKLERRFYEQFEFCSKNPFPNSTMGKLDLPMISYSAPEFIKRIKAGEKSVIVSGACPLSIISDELGFKLSDGRKVRPKMGFETLPPEYENIEEISWPKRPILSDYVSIKNILELYSNLRSNSKISVIIWYPYHEYFLDLTENILKNYLTSGVIHTTQIIKGLNKLKNQYFKLIDFIKSELALKPAHEKDIMIIEVNENKFHELERYQNSLDFTFFQNIYGSWHGNELRRKLFEQLIIKHIRHVFDNFNTLHLDNSYELWVDILGSILVEQNQAVLPGNFSWLSYSTIPSISMSWMREFNAPDNDKLYLALEKSQFITQLDRLPMKYITHIAPLILGKDGGKDKKLDEIFEEFKIKVSKINSSLNI